MRRKTGLPRKCSTQGMRAKPVRRYRPVPRVRNGRLKSKKRADPVIEPPGSAHAAHRSEMQRPLVTGQSGLVHDFRQRRMGVADTRQIFTGGARLHGHHGFRKSARTHSPR